jgi:prostaglandin-endoperoxide synthase 2
MTTLVEVPVPDVTPPVPAGHKTELTLKQKWAEFKLSMPTRCGWAWRFAQRVPRLERIANRYLINKGVNLLPPRPYRLSTNGDFTSHESLVDKTYNSRQLPPTVTRKLRTTPAVDDVLALFERKEFIPSDKSTVLFAYVAQWFTDGFLRSNRSDEKAVVRDITVNESTHEVDLAQLYGLRPEITTCLRDPDNPMLLASQGPVGEELPPDLFDANGDRVPQYAALRIIGVTKGDVDNKQLLAMGVDAGNTQIGYAMLNTLFLREHNRIANEIAEATSEDADWDDPNRIFAAARSVLTVMLIKVVIEEYINHLHPYFFQFRLDPRGFDKQPWMRPNWVAVEFNLLYRWHSMIPSVLDVGSDRLPLGKTFFRTKDLLTKPGLAQLIDSASRQPAGKIGLHNTDEWLLQMAERPSIQAGRTVRLRGYNEYRKQCKMVPAKNFWDISSNPDTVRMLGEIYKDANDVEFFVGLFAEDTRPNSALPPLIGKLVGLHAFSQLMTNPLFAPEVFNAETFSRRGMEIIAGTKSLDEVVQRNISAKEKPPLVTLTRTDWQRQ